MHKLYKWGHEHIYFVCLGNTTKLRLYMGQQDIWVSDEEMGFTEEIYEVGNLPNFNPLKYKTPNGYNLFVKDYPEVEY